MTLNIPNSWEIHVNLTNAQWHLGLLGFFIVVSRRPSGAAEWMFDLLLLALAGLSGPFQSGWVVDDIDQASAGRTRPMTLPFPGLCRNRFSFRNRRHSLR